MDPTPRDLIIQACRALFAPGQVVELRVLGIDRGQGRKRGTAAGWFNDLDALATAAAGYDGRELGRPEGIYVTINPVHEACLARGSNIVTDWPERTTTDKEILRRHWLPIDLDPVKPAGTSSTDAELQASRELARQVYAWLENECGWPAGVRAHSGNGTHLLYRIDLPNDDDARRLVSACLAAIDSRFSTPTVKVDKGLINAARILKLYGTCARKGHELPDRPHRRSHLFAVNGVFPTFGQVGVVTREQLERLAALAPVAGRTRAAASARRAKPTAPTQGTNPDYAVDLDAFIAEHNLTVIREEPFDDTGKRYILDCCIFDPSHTGTSAALGRSRDGNVFYKCWHDSCAGRGWKDVRAKLGSAGGAPPVAAEKKPKKASKADDDDPWELAAQILDEEFTDADTGQVRLRRHRESWLLYRPTPRCYRVMDDDWASVTVRRWMGANGYTCSNRKTADVVNCLGAMVTAPAEIELPFLSKIDPETGCCSGDPARRNWITLRNGILDLDRVLAGEPFADCLMAHTCDWLSLIALPFPFPTKEAQLACPTWLRFLNEIFEGDETRIALLQEAFGSCFLPGSEHEAFFVLHGAGQNGKSTALNVLRALLSEDNCASLSVEQIADKYLIGGLYGKLANICADMNEMDRVQEGLLKAIVSGDSITADRKYKSSIQFKPTCKLFFATNVLPRFTDTSLGIWRRMILIPFNYTVPSDRRDIGLFKRLQAEMPGIFVWALQGLVRLREQGSYTVSEVCQSAARDYRLHCFPILLFLDECTSDTEPEYTCTAHELWTAYRRWCAACGLRKPKPLHQMLRDVVTFRPRIQYSRVSPGMEAHRVLYGIRVRDEAKYATVPTTGGDYGSIYE